MCMLCLFLPVSWFGWIQTRKWHLIRLLSLNHNKIEKLFHDLKKVWFQNITVKRECVVRLLCFFTFSAWHSSFEEIIFNLDKKCQKQPIYLQLGYDRSLNLKYIYIYQQVNQIRWFCLCFERLLMWPYL